MCNPEIAFDLEHAVRESNTIEGVANEGYGLEDHLSAGLWMLTEADKDSLAHPRALHHLLMSHMWLPEGETPGEYRNCAVRVGHHLPPAPWLIDSLMGNWDLDYIVDGDKTPWFMHAWFEEIHPFIDGNGRVGRLIWWNLSLLRGEEPEIIMAGEKHDYYRRLEQWRADPDRRARETRP